MKTSKLEPYRDYIVAEAKKRIRISRICKGLEKLGCKVSRSYLKEWMEKSGIKYTPHKRGCPPGARLFSLLPEAGDDPQINLAHMFLFSLLEGISKENRIDYCKRSVAALGLPSCSMDPEQWDDLKKYADLSDPELLLLAYLRSDLGAPPLSEGSQPLGAWYSTLATMAMELRETIAAAIESRKQ
jgi:hypothetical protein